MIRANNLTLRRGVKILLQDAEFVIHPGERVGIVGPNGAGKSTLFGLFSGTLDADAGTLDMPAGWRIASVAQEVASSDKPAREFVIDGDTGLRQLQQQRAETSPDDGARIAELENALVEADAWSAHSRAEQLLAGLGFRPDQWQLPVSSFSGGWRMRLALARALMAPSELLLLDEPTNHLDLDAMLWLERWLASYPGTVLMISHDTEFLNAVARIILHFDHQKLVRYRGDYDSFLEQRAERLRQAHIALDRQNREAARLQSFIDRFKAKATKAKQAQSRVKALARMEKLAPIHAEYGVDIRIPEPQSMPDPLLILEQLELGYEGLPSQLNGIDLMVRGGDRIGILGVNGAGKSTLIKSLAGSLTPRSGLRKASPGLAIGYFAQHQLDMLDLGSTPLQHLARIAPDVREQELRNYLGGFGFGGDNVLSPVAPMSGGEKARLALSLIVWQRPNLLLLDEPSNHLDVETREALSTALAEFSGSMLLVSHDRHLLRTTVDQFWIVADGTVQPFDGDLEDYRDWLQARAAGIRSEERAAARQSANDGQGSNQNRKEVRRQEAEARQALARLRKPLEQKLQKIEKEMDHLQSDQADLDRLIADPEFYTSADRDLRTSSLARHGENAKKLAQLEESWLALQEEMESLETAATSAGG